jgi:hypothetical protein
MTPSEQAAFVEAYGRQVAMIGDKDVADFVRRYSSGEDIDYSGEYTSIVDALGMWNEAIKWKLTEEISHD